MLVSKADDSACLFIKMASVETGWLFKLTDIGYYTCLFAVNIVDL